MEKNGTSLAKSALQTLLEQWWEKILGQQESFLDMICDEKKDKG